MPLLEDAAAAVAPEGAVAPEEESEEEAEQEEVAEGGEERRKRGEISAERRHAADKRCADAVPPDTTMPGEPRIRPRNSLISPGRRRMGVFRRHRQQRRSPTGTPVW